MLFRLRSVLFLVFAAMIGLAADAQAHTKLVSTEPSADTEVAAPKTIQLHFTEGFETKFSSFKLTDTDGKDVPVKIVESKDPKTLTGVPQAPLLPGLYTVTWTTVARDSHKMTGSYSFTVK